LATNSSLSRIAFLVMAGMRFRQNPSQTIHHNLQDQSSS